jgi:HPr kinase/phosphorylase
MNQFKNPKIIRQNEIPVEVLLQSPIKLKSLTSKKGLSKSIKDVNLYRPQLALAGYVGLFNYHRVQIFGNTEIFYLKTLSPENRKKALSTLLKFPIPCIILTNNHELDAELIQMAEDSEVHIFNTPYDTTKAFTYLSEFLHDQFASQIVVHGSFVDVYGVGILFTGSSGIGKSEIALDLIERGHRLVADDVVMLTKKRSTVLMGTGTNMVQHFMEIRGLGIIDIRQMFGIRSIRFQKRLEIIVELEEWTKENQGQYTRTGLEEEPIEIMGVEVSTVKLPIFPGKNKTSHSEGAERLKNPESRIKTGFFTSFRMTKNTILMLFTHSLRFWNLDCETVC